MTMHMVVLAVIEVVEYVNDTEWDGDENEDEHVVEVIEIPIAKTTTVPAYEVGIGQAPPPFLTTKEKAKLALELATRNKGGEATQQQQARISSSSTASQSQRKRAVSPPTTLPAFMEAPTFDGSRLGYAFRTTPENGTGYHLDEYQLRQNPNLYQQLLRQLQQKAMKSGTNDLPDKWWVPEEPDNDAQGEDWWVSSPETTTNTGEDERGGEPPMFISAPTFQGSKPGYAFRTSPLYGTGYHLDEVQLEQDPTLWEKLEQQYAPRRPAPPPPAAPAAPAAAAAAKPPAHAAAAAASATPAAVAAAPVPPPATPPDAVVSPRRSLEKQATKRLTIKKHQSIIDLAIAGMGDDDEEYEVEEEEIIIEEEEIIEEEYYDEEEEEEIIEEEYYEEDDDEYEEYYDDDEEYIIEEIIVEEETVEEAEARKELEREIAEIERQIAEAKAAKEKKVAEEGEDHQDSAKEKAEMMAANSRLEACKAKKTELSFKQKAAARAKMLAEREKNWGKKGKKKQKDLSEIIASKAKKQKKLMARHKAMDAAKKKRAAAAAVAGGAGSAKSPETSKAEAPAAAAPAVEEEKPREEGRQLTMAEMLAKKAAIGIKGQEVGKAKASVDIKSAAPDDFGDEDLKLEDFLPSDDEEEEEEEEPELTPEQRHQKSLQWEKPSWTQAKLRTTTKGNKIKAGKYLSAPITHIPKKVNEGLEEEDDDGTPSQAALMKGAIAMIQLPKAKKAHAGLKFTGNGARIRDGRKIEKQINPKVKNKDEVKIWGADPEDLKLTPRGLTARKGKILSEEITNATQTKKHAFEKPAWAKTKPSHLLKTTETGQHLKEGEDIAPKITHTEEEKKHAWAKPSWTTKNLKTTDEGKKVKSGAYLSAPIVDLNKKTMNVNMEANPAFLKMTEQGEKLMEEGNLEGPITAATARNHQ